MERAPLSSLMGAILMGTPKDASPNPSGQTRVHRCPNSPNGIDFSFGKVASAILAGKRENLYVKKYFSHSKVLSYRVAAPVALTSTDCKRSGRDGLSSTAAEGYLGTAAHWLLYARPWRQTLADIDPTLWRAFFVTSPDVDALSSAEMETYLASTASKVL